MQTVLWRAWAVRERTEVGAPMAQGMLSGFNVGSFFIRLERTEPFGRLVESRLKILAGVRGSSDVVRAQQGEKERDPEFMVLSQAFPGWSDCNRTQLGDHGWRCRQARGLSGERGAGIAS